MKAIAIVPGTQNLSLVERPEPQIAAPDEIKLQILQVGICGTDREEAAGGRADAPAGSKELVIGHENFGKVVAVGSAVKAVKPGDYAVFTVRRECDNCICGHHPDMCFTGKYRERGIKGLDGYETEFVVDKEKYINKVPDEIAHIGVLAEPMSVAEKAINESVRIQCGRLPEANATDWLKGKQVLVAGLGPIGLLAAFILRLRGANVLGLDIVDENTIRPDTLNAIGGKYVDGRKVKTEDIDDAFGQIDMIFEATGVASLEFELIDALGINGIYVLTGIPGGDRPLTIIGAPLLDQIVLKNQLLLGSVNASIEDWSRGIAELLQAHQQYPDAIAKVITDKVPVSNFKDALLHHGDNEIKCVIEWAEV
ncbi:MAG TPA: glucose 1-dehydrogenase [Chitinophagaceae bacterium]